MELFCPSAAAKHEQLLISASERAALRHAPLQKPADERQRAGPGRADNPPWTAEPPTDAFSSLAVKTAESLCRARPSGLKKGTRVHTDHASRSKSSSNKNRKLFRLGGATSSLHLFSILNANSCLESISKTLPPPQKKSETEKTWNPHQGQKSLTLLLKPTKTQSAPSPN